MPDVPPRKPGPGASAPEPPEKPQDDAAAADDAETGAREERGIGDFVRRAVSAGFEVASRSKDDLLRVATGEIRAWLDHLDLDKELAKALSKMTIEVNAQIRFHPREDGSLEPK